MQALKFIHRIANMSNTETVQKVLKEHSNANIDTYIQASCFKDEVAEVSRNMTGSVERLAAR